MAYNIADLFEHVADRVPDRLALIVGDEHVTYGELDARANQVAHRFASLGVGPGDHIGIYGYNGTPWVEAMLAAFKLRAVPININFRYVEEELTYLLDNADCTVVVYDPEFSTRLEAVRPRLPRLEHAVPIDGTWATARVAHSAARDFDARSPDDHYMLYTGGTTGMPKGVVWRQEDVFMALGQGIDAITGHKVESDTELAAKAAANPFPIVSFMLPPLMHGACQWGMLGMMFQGNTVVLTPRFDVDDVWSTVQREGANAIMITGDAMGRPLIEALDTAPDRWDVSSLLAVSSSAALFSAPVKDRFFAHFPNLVITDSIGSSEGGFNGIAQVAKDDTAMKGGPTVKPAPDVVVVDDKLRVLSPSCGIVGKVARGGNIPIGYYKDEAKTATTFLTASDGRRYVVAGDFALWEDDGTITLLGRGSMCINSGGEKIFPEEVESALKSHADVFDALVVGAADDRWGQRVAAVVQPRPGAAPSLDDLSAHCRTRLAGYKVPRELHLVDVIVRSPSGKPDYPWAQQLVAEANEDVNA
jgi:acyl-CoA synthetase (AMP-forming)/AMP-acid ligase II